MFEEKIKGFAERIELLKDNILTEEATKTSLIMPFFALLGYDVFNPLEFIPEFIADIKMKKDEKVDYAIKLNEKISILIESKSINENLEKHRPQLRSYFMSVPSAKFGILTNGIQYEFFSDLDESNIMDAHPFFSFDLSDIKDSDITELKRYEKNNFDMNSIINVASDLKYCNLIKKYLKTEFSTPSDKFTKNVLSSDIYIGKITQNVIDKFKPIIKKSISQYINELVNDKIKNALTIENTAIPDGEVVEELPESEEIDAINTTEEELQAYYIVKSILCSLVDLERISYKDTVNYFSVLLDGKVTRWICRIYLKEHVKYIIIPDEKEHVKYNIENINDLYKLSDTLRNRIASLQS